MLKKTAQAERPVQPRRRQSSPGGNATQVKPPSNVSGGIKKSKSFAATSNSRGPLEEDFKFTGSGDLCPGVSALPTVGKKHGNPEELIRTGITQMLQQYTRSPQPNLDEFNKKASQIYDTVGKTIRGVLENVSVQNNPSAAKLKVSERIAAYTPAYVFSDKPVDDSEENLPVHPCSLSPSPIPTSGIQSVPRTDSVETDPSAPHSASSKRSINSSHPSSSSSRRSDYAETDQSVPHSTLSKALSQYSDNSSHPSSSSSRISDYVETDPSAPHSASSKRSINSSHPSSSSSRRSESDQSAPHSESSQHSIDLSNFVKTSVKDPQKIEPHVIDKTTIKIASSCQLSPLIHGNKLHVLKRYPTATNDMLEAYNLIDGDITSQEVTQSYQTGSHLGLKMFYSKNLSLFTYSSTTRLCLYQLQTKTSPASWEQTLRPSAPQIDPTNSFPIPYKDDGVIIVTIITEQPTSQIKFHIFSYSKAEKRKSTACHLLSNAKFQVRSCVILSNCIYCSFILPNEIVYFYKFDIALLRKEPKKDESIPPIATWSLKDSTVQNCFMSVLQGMVYSVLIFTNQNKKTIMEVKRLLQDSKFSSVDYQFEFPCVVKVAAASVIPGDQHPLITVVYQDNADNFFFKRVTML